MKRAVAALAGGAVTALVAGVWAGQQRPAAATGQPDRATGDVDSPPQSWERTNYRGRTVSLSGGIAAAAGTTATAATGGGTVRTASAAALATAGAAAFGLVDDRDPDPGTARGLRGHLRALAHGQITTGTLKLFGIPALSLVAAAVMDREGRPIGSSLIRRGLDVLTSGALIAGTANLINLFDLRPGRALKATTVIAAPLAVLPGPAGRLGAGACGVVAAAWADDLGERTMLGDTGANALGALVGTGLALVPSAAVRAGALTGVVALIVLSEKVSFSAVIDRTPLAHAADRWGRLP
ncbi:hypothetical protein [Ruania zhangjianzhongii]|uniref:hypothetical protein n=1 Tax=Ruania zhangjianzhongii TaxID=2603206 RepID=UPI001F2F13B6|nr:hypothetical protein [Ruania zhangjianzhongii]